MPPARTTAPHWLNRPKRKKYDYIPTPNSGAYVILVTMLKIQQNEFIRDVNKELLQAQCTKYFPSSMRDFSKVWPYMKGLIEKSLIGRIDQRVPEYYLTDEGYDLAIKSEAARDPFGNDLNTEDDSNSCSVSSQVFSQQDGNFELAAGTFDIILVKDSREKMDLISNDESIRIETIPLAVGDFIWLARPKGVPASDKTKDLVLDYVVERKRLDDLQSSIFDGRFEQQKLRLLNSGMRHPTFLIEDCALARQNNLTSSGLNQAIVNILIQDGLEVARSKTLPQSLAYLITMTKSLTKFYSNKTLKSCNQERLKSPDASKNEMITFSEFQTKSAKIKNWTIREMFAKHLIQITGMSEIRVSVIIKKYPTLTHLLDAYNRCETEVEKENLLSKLSIPDSNRTIGPAISKRIYYYYKS